MATADEMQHEQKLLGSIIDRSGIFASEIWRLAASFALRFMNCSSEFFRRQAQISPRPLAQMIISIRPSEIVL
jgi:hypothetical protein